MLEKTVIAHIGRMSSQVLCLCDVCSAKHVRLIPNTSTENFFKNG